jgi:hypothetical protein
LWPGPTPVEEPFYIGGVTGGAHDPRDVPDLPDVEPNRKLLEAFRGQGVLVGPAMEYRSGRWELHTHPDLEGALADLAPVRSMYTVFGLSCLAAGPADRAVAAVVARGMSILMFRLPARPGGLEVLNDLDGPGPAQGWYAYDAWFSADSEHGQRLRSLTHAAYAFAAELATGLADDTPADMPKGADSRSDRPGTAARRAQTKPQSRNRGNRRNP